MIHSIMLDGQKIAENILKQHIEINASYRSTIYAVINHAKNCPSLMH